MLSQKSNSKGAKDEKSKKTNDCDSEIVVTSKRAKDKKIKHSDKTCATSSYSLSKPGAFRNDNKRVSSSDSIIDPLLKKVSKFFFK